MHMWQASVENNCYQEMPNIGWDWACSCHFRSGTKWLDHRLGALQIRGGGGGGRQNAATRRNMRREERVTVQGPVKEQQPDGMSHRGGHTGQQALHIHTSRSAYALLMPTPPPPRARRQTLHMGILPS